MTQRIILFNGTPSSGKDTAARACMEAEDLNGLPRVFDRMSMPIKRAFAGMVNRQMDRWGNVDEYEANKEMVIPFLGVSYRQWQIDFSEKFMKPLYGTSIFAALFALRQARQDKNAVIFVPDCGFDIEYTYLTKEFVFGQQNVLVVKLYRPGYDFTKDSRSYLRVGSFGNFCNTEPVIHINNAGTVEDFKAKVVSRVGKWLTQGDSK